MKSEQLIISKQRVKDFGEVFTPEKLVKEMCNVLQERCFEHNTTFLEPTCGTGNFLAEVLNRKLYGLSIDCDSDQSLLEKMYEAIGSLYGFDIQDDNVSITKQRLLNQLVHFAKGYGIELDSTLLKVILDTNIRQADFLKLAETALCKAVVADGVLQLHFYLVDFSNGGASKEFLITKHPIAEGMK